MTKEEFMKKMMKLKQRQKDAKAKTKKSKEVGEASDKLVQMIKGK